MTLRRTAAVAFERVGLERPAYRAWEWAQAARALPELLAYSSAACGDGLPLPPPLLRVQVMGTARPEEFLAQGRRAAASVRDAVREGGRELDELEAILDFGCGCGRVMRRWADLDGPELFGSDYNAKLVAWCAQNLPFAQFGVNELTPPLLYPDDRFDLVYALSVFTHLTEPLQHAWMAELRRVIRPGGLLVFSTRGDAHAGKLPPSERARYDAGALVTRYDDVTGTNLCAAFHPTAYVHDVLLEGFTRVRSLPAALLDGAQDLHVAERAH